MFYFRTLVTDRRSTSRTQVNPTCGGADFLAKGRDVASTRRSPRLSPNEPTARDY